MISDYGTFIQIVSNAVISVISLSFRCFSVVVSFCWPTFPKQTNLHSSTWRSGSTGQSEEDSQSGSGSEVLWVGEVVPTGDK